MSRRVVASLGLTIDGCYQGPGGRWDHGAITAYGQTSDAATNQLMRSIGSATTAVIGRVVAEHFREVWPAVIGKDGVDPRDEAYATWLVGAEKVILSRTLTDIEWEGARVVNAPAAQVIAELSADGEGDILVNHSPSVIKALLAANLVDRLNLMVAPVIVGGDYRLFDAGLPGSTWALVAHEVDSQGVVGLTYDRRR